MRTLIEARRQISQAEHQPFETARGPHLPGWERSGLDLLAAIAAQPGGLKGNFVVTRSASRTSLMAYGTAETLAVPAGWSALASVADERPGEGLREYSILFRGDSLVIVSAHRLRRIGTATCVDSDGGAILYATSAAPVTGRDGAAVDSFERMRNFGRHFTLCTVAKRRPDGSFQLLSFDDQGRTLPELDAFTGPDRNTIEPRAPIQSYRMPRP
jgi:hypothetical protein